MSRCDVLSVESASGLRLRPPVAASDLRLRSPPPTSASSLRPPPPASAPGLRLRPRPPPPVAASSLRPPPRLLTRVLLVGQRRLDLRWNTSLRRLQGTRPNFVQHVRGRTSLLVDYHVHYHAHGDSGPYTVDRLDSIVAAARSGGVAEVGISEHIFRFVEFRDVVGAWWTNFDDRPELEAHCERYIAEHATQRIADYVDFLTKAKESGYPIKIGLEVDHYPGMEASVAQFLEDLPLDYVLGSVHWIGAWGFDNEEVLDEWERRDVDRVWASYFKLLEDLVESGIPDILAHPDVVKKFGFRPRSFDLASAWERLVQRCVQRGVVLEVSSAGLRMPVSEIYPAPDLLAAAVSKGAQVVTASDAHVPELVGYRFDELRATFSRCGVRQLTVFRDRSPEGWPV
jgi:histidinol-phosphatase (PHP family)